MFHGGCVESLRQRAPNRAKCPLCRVPILGILNLFFEAADRTGLVVPKRPLSMEMTVGDNDDGGQDAARPLANAAFFSPSHDPEEVPRLVHSNSNGSYRPFIRIDGYTNWKSMYRG